MLTCVGLWHSERFLCRSKQTRESGETSARGQRTESEERRDREVASDGGEMLAVFDPTVAKCPEGLRSPPVAGAAAAAGGAGAGALMKGFSDSHDGAVTVSLGPSSALAYSAANQNPLVPRCCCAPRPVLARLPNMCLCDVTPLRDAKMVRVCVLGLRFGYVIASWRLDWNGVKLFEVPDV